MATELIPTGTTAADSADVVVIAGTPVTIFLKSATNGPVDSAAVCEIKVKSVGATYHKIGELTGRCPVQVIDGPGTFRISRLAGPTFGVDQG